nr:ribonuclease III [uncultured Lichenicoccus sp.]
MSEARDRIEALLQWRFRRPELLSEALTHRSVANEHHGVDGRGAARSRRGTGRRSNERLEFIGDRVLGLLMAEWLIERYPDEPEGEIGLRHARLVSRAVLAGIAASMGLSDALAVSEHETRAGVRQAATVLADAIEAVLGAAYLDGGLEPARSFIRTAWAEAIEAQTLPPKDAKTALQEWLLGRGRKLPVYVVESAKGPSHAPVFVIRVTAAGASGIGTASTKRAAESAAAADLLAQVRLLEKPKLEKPGLDKPGPATPNLEGKTQ